jgi:phosphoserine phosphatase RsbU/P
MPATDIESVLIIDDDHMVRASMVAVIEDMGYGVFEALSGEHGLELFRRYRPAVVVCDLRMPLMSGFDVLSQVHAIDREAQVIVVSGAGVMSDVVAALRLGAADYLIKPIKDLQMLEHAVKKGVEQNRLLRENRLYREALEQKNRELNASLLRLEEDQKAGRLAQSNIMPPASRDIGAIHIEQRIYPSLYLSGDFIEYFKVSPSRIGFYLADVSGHGASSAFVTIFLKTITNRMRRRLRHEKDPSILSPARMLTALNSELLKLKFGKHIAMFTAVIDTDANTLTYAMAAHFPLPMIVNGNDIYTLEGDGLPVGLFKNASYENHVTHLCETFSLIVMSDGILELMGEMPLKEKESYLLELIRNGNHTIDALEKRLKIGETQVAPDDIAILTVCRKGL